MKHLKTLIISLFFVISLPLFSQITIKFKNINIEEGYEYEGKIKVYIDGEFVGESPSCQESVWCNYTIKTTGEHTIKIERWAKYEGNWEQRTIANNFSYDYVYEDTLTFKKKQTLTLVWDIHTGIADVKLKR